MELIKLLETRQEKSGQWRSYAIFRCDGCKSEVERRLSLGKRDKSCGQCKPKNYKHGESKTRLYNIWNGMKKRCLNPNQKGYKDYGGRGITICPEWADKLNGYINFRDWALSNGYQDNLTIDRKETNGNYEPNNCRWETSKENQRNRRNNKLTQEKVNKIRYLHNTGNYTQRELAKKYNVSEAIISRIINNKIWK